MVTTRRITPPPPQDTERSSGSHISQPTRTALRTITRFVQDFNLDVSQNAIFKYLEISARTGYRALQSGADTESTLKEGEKRGRKRRFSETDIDAVEDYIRAGGLEGRIRSWVEIFEEAVPQKSDTSRITIKNAVDARGYYKCSICQNPYLSQRFLQQRENYLAHYRAWSLDEWRKVRFSDICHFQRVPKQKFNLKLIRRRGDRFHPTCMQNYADETPSRQAPMKRFHIWVAIGYNFKSDLVIFSATSNDRMPHEVYLENVLKHEVQSWIKNKDQFVLEEDQESIHGLRESNWLIEQWKQQVGLEYFLNAAGSPNVAPVEDIWRVQPSVMDMGQHDDDDSVIRAIQRSWNQIPMEAINRHIDSMFERVHSLAERNGIGVNG